MIPLARVSLIVLAAGAVPAAASSNYPGALASHIGADAAPACTVCHETNAGGAGTVVKPFGRALVAEGLTGGGDTAGLEAALDALDASNTDSDGDGTPDIDELRAGDDPNAAGGSREAPPPVGYGFGCASSPLAPVLLSFMLPLALAWRSWRR